MQTLNVDAGRTENEYRAAEEQRRGDLRDESEGDANYFFWAAGLAAVGSGLFPVRLNILVSIGAFDVLRLNGLFGKVYVLVVCAWLIALVALGFAARRGLRWAFVAGLIMYGMDMVILIPTFSFGAFGVHAFFVFRWFQGQKALQDLHQTAG